MKIQKLEIKNYRTIEYLDISFPTYYAALCGKNNAGKTNIIKAIRAALEQPSYNTRFSFKEDFPLWKSFGKEKVDESINIKITLSVGQSTDAGLYKFIEKFATLEGHQIDFSVAISISITSLRAEKEIKIAVNNKAIEDYSSKEILNKIQSSSAILFHNSTMIDDIYARFPFRSPYGGLLSEITSTDKEKYEKMQKQFDSLLSRLAKQHQKDIAELLGKLEDKYQVGLSIPNINIEYFPYDMSLGDKNVTVPLKEWGSGTRNRTEILLHLLKAKKITEAIDVSEKITPVIIIEEPESFLHPSAQAEFGRVLQDLAEEFKVQVITTTHSPYMLSLDEPEANILLQRSFEKNQLKKTEVVDTSDSQWMKPFGLALGINNAEFEPWKNLLFFNSNKILLVEGDIDKEYLELVKDQMHSKNMLQFDGEIFPFCGKDSLRNPILLNFIKERYKKFFIVIDLDCKDELKRTFDMLGLKENVHYTAAGLDQSGKRNIEGLLPDNIISKVYGDNPDLVQQAVNGDSQEKKSAKHRLKKLLLEEFKASAQPGQDFCHFYSLAKIINKAFS